MSAPELKVYELFKKRFSEEQAQTVIEFFEAKAEEKIQQKKDIFLVKDDKVDIIEKMSSGKVELIKWMFLFWVGQLAAMLAFLKFLN